MKKTITVLAALAVCATAATAQDLPQPVKARQGQFNILALNLGVLGGMAKGAVEYDAEAAQAAADNIAAVASLHQAAMWTEGTDNMSIDGTRAQPVIWEQMDDFNSKWEDLGTAATEMASAAGTGQEALAPMLGKVGGACKACHDTYRAPE